MVVHNGDDEVMMICIDNHQQHREAPIRVYAENRGANHAQAKVAVHFRGRPSLKGRLHHISESSCVHPRVGSSGREEDTSVPISREEVTSRHHLSAMPDPLQPPLSLRMPCPEGIRQRRPRRERVCDDLSTIWFRRSVYDLYLGDTHGVSMCGYSRQP